MKMSIRKSDLLAALTCAAVKDIRSYLNGVYLEFIPTSDGGIVQFVGTDGSAMFFGNAPAVFLEYEQAAPFWMTIPSDAIKLACKGKYDLITLASMDDGRYALGDVIFAALDGKYPDYRRVIPDSVSGEIGNYDADLLAKAQKALNLYFQTKDKVFRLNHNGINGAAVMAGNSRDAGVVIMPIKIATEKYAGLNVAAMPGPLKAVA
jgi:DNA polymerase III sliding clamp (beta) subunit (PCNA family)